ncbi:citrate lyase acyl carrier protein [Loigolactobacillus coryniformis]|jgi:citrate lyase subunit gamma (acyl carrier protein)|uniref:Citrate lyase acyl carrier protein n=1 Tax=Loigolactobacillus coryniformis subsp. coryniformis KCTC 3167 = DSM 20001 TaxID=913848 RepID=A0A0R1EXS8_9LACO|nr:citrate lyase acyl carrier protein [Loigolactobacillus coryniformis]ATO54584.1 citrate lyase acyl carrier protein [Loigolactobacillus coryniformis subsp. coryniformis KCTC 3167 = DSM 20001]KRK14393.1 citrate lyase subunit gamma [Loigolactobacillus coryniformis subsp. coryniformis KCTC 3167 = DSM 20001]MDT3393499.1 citrate lyase acyl carrier protein [Bacillota bacterium]OEH90588.1 citrate lyase [Loigolactobacillus coryniformis subsp. coryniformis]
MEIKKTATAGTLESSDIQIIIDKGSDGIKIQLDSDVKKEFGEQIESVIRQTLVANHIDQANVKAVDKGALDCVIKARTLAAANRALDTADKPSWEVL